MNKCLYCERETKNPKYCSSSCSAKANNESRLTKACANCGAKILSRNKYCNITCQHEAQNTNKINKLLEGEYYNTPIVANKGSWLRKYLIKALGEKCAECGIGNEYNGKPLTLEVDHINGRCNNNVIDNLRFLCPNCHSQTDTYKAKNPVSDRVTRYTKIISIG